MEEDDQQGDHNQMTDHLARPEDQHRPTMPQISYYSAALFSHHSKTKLRRLLFHLLPSFVKPAGKSAPKHGVAALDGLRGLASLFVFNEHYMIFYMSRGSQHWINHIPFLRLWRYGKGAVYLFFVISGYVLSYKPLKQARARDYRGFQKTMSSSILRRGFRLYLPCLVASAVMAIMTIAGLYHWPARIFGRTARLAIPPRVTTTARQITQRILANLLGNCPIYLLLHLPLRNPHLRT